MKKILSIAFAAMLCLSANAATVNWGIYGATYFGSTNMKTENATGYLVYLGENSSWDDYGTANIVDIVKNGSTDYPSIAVNTKNGQVSNSIGMDAGSSFTFDSSSKSGTAPSGSYFGLLYAYTTGSNDQYYFAGSIYQFSETDTGDGGHYDSDLQTFTWKDDKIPTSNDSTGASQGWVAVPEPSTAALALAGLALLLKRRKA